ISVPLSASFGQFILKLSQDGYPHLVENEAAHLHASRSLGLSVSEGQLVRDRSGETGLLVRRFDRARTHKGWQRLAFEDATQIMNLPPANKYTVDAESAISSLASTTAAPVIAAHNLYLQFVFAWLTGNGDLHAKNIGVLRSVKGMWSIAPIYDIPCTLIYDDDSMALPINGRTRKLRSRDWEAFEESIGLRPRAAARARALAVRAASALDWTALPFSGSPLHRVERELRRRRDELVK
ncbi:MAG: type II toxin-antitoxin system HipA family toxin, partial [Stackebrandtia sp.]